MTDEQWAAEQYRRRTHPPAPARPGRTPELARIEAFERRVSEAATSLLFGRAPDAQPEPEPFAFGRRSALVEAVTANAERITRAAQRITRAAHTRAATHTTSGDVAGVMIDVTVPEWVRAAVDAQQADARRLIDGVRTAPITRGARPIIPGIGPPVPAAKQAGEKQQLSSRTITVPGAVATPDQIGATANISEQVMRPAGDLVLAILMGDAVAGVAAAIVAELDAAAGAAAADLPAAFAQVEASGYAPDTVVASRSAFATHAPNAVTTGTYAGITPLYAPTGSSLYVVALGGVYAAIGEAVEWQVSQPSIGGYEVSAFVEVLVSIQAGAVAKV